MAELKTDYKDDVFSGNRKFRPISNPDGTASFVDMTDYSQVGDTYGAAEINAQNTFINEKGIVVSDTSIPVEQRIVNNLYFFYT